MTTEPRCQVCLKPAPHDGQYMCDRALRRQREWLETCGMPGCHRPATATVFTDVGEQIPGPCRRHTDIFHERLAAAAQQSAEEATDETTHLNDRATDAL